LLQVAAVQSQRARVSPDPQLLDEAIVQCRSVLDVMGESDPLRAGCLAVLGENLKIRFTRTGGRQDIDQAVDLQREAVKVLGPDNQSRGPCLAGLAASLRTRFERVGDVADLTAAVETARRALAATTDNSRDRAEQLSNLGAVLLTRYMKVDPPSATDIDEAVELHRQAVAATARSRAEWAKYQSMLGGSHPLPSTANCRFLPLIFFPPSNPLVAAPTPGTRQLPSRRPDFRPSRPPTWRAASPRPSSPTGSETRKRQRPTQRDVAAAMGVSVGRVSQIGQLGTSTKGLATWSCCADTTTPPSTPGSG
jgi:predicted nucleic acid-binding protein